MFRNSLANHLIIIIIIKLSQNKVGKDLYQVVETLKKLCEFSTVWADRADFGSTDNFCNFAKVSYL